jgi:hypothetical protein
MAITHSFVSAKSDGGDATLVRPSDWNDDHVSDIYEAVAGSGPIVIPDFRGSRLRIPSSPHGSDNEFSTSTVGMTTLGTLNTIDSNTTIADGLYIERTATGADLDGAYVTIPSIPIKVETVILGTKWDSIYQSYGLMLGESGAAGKWWTTGLQNQGQNVPRLWRQEWTTRTSSGTANTMDDHRASAMRPCFMRLDVTSSTVVHMEISTDGVTWSRMWASVNPMGGTTVALVGLLASSFQNGVMAAGTYGYLRFYS